MIEKYLKQIIAFFETLSSKPRVGAFQITNSSIQYVALDDRKAEPFAIAFNLPPEVMEEGKVKDDKRFLHLLRQLNRAITRSMSVKRVRVVVCLPSIITYTQTFEIPNVGKDRLKESAELNLKALSPIPIDNAYMSWQLINETDDKYEIFGAFAEKDVVDKFRLLLTDAGFSPIIFEFPSLSLAWLINKVVGVKSESILVLSISSDGIDIFLLKKGSIYFDYFRSWKSIQGADRQISKSAFDNVVIEETRKVVNFIADRSGEVLKRVILIAPGMEKGVKKVIEDNFSVEVIPLVAKFGKLGSSWYTAIGSAIRGGWDRSRDKFVSLGTEMVQEVFYREQAIDFVKLWRNILAGMAGVLLVLFVFSVIFLRAQPRLLKTRLDILNIQAHRSELRHLEATAKEFNDVVAAIDVARERTSPSFSLLLNALLEISEEQDVILDNISAPSVGGMVSVSARAPDHNIVIKFKNELVNNSAFVNVTLPLSSIVATADNFVRFSISFNFAGE